MRIFIFDIEKIIENVKEALSEIRSFSDILEIIEEIKSIKDVLMDILNEEIESMLENNEINKQEADKILSDFIMLIEEKLQFDLNKLSSQVFSLENLLFKKKK